MKKLNFVLLFLFSIQLWAQSNIEVINIENPAVQAYMADSTYFYNSDYRTSIARKYYNTSLYGERLDWPQGKNVTWTPTVSADNIQEIRITVSERENFKDSVTHNPSSNDETSFIIRNTIPGRTYYYKVEEIQVNGTKTQVAKGAFRTTGQVRMIQVRGVRNVRDLGGWPTQYGVPVKYGILYRSANLDVMNAFGRHDFADNLNVGAELDLRGESKLKQSRLGADKDLLVLPHDAGLKGLTNNKHKHATDLRWIISRLREGKNVNWHCAIGCDRCGTVSFLIEGLLGLSEVDLCRDFELSTFSNRPRPRAHVKSMITNIRTYGPADDLAKCFYNYWLSTGMNKDELDYFLHVMLDYQVKQGPTLKGYSWLSEKPHFSMP